MGTKKLTKLQHNKNKKDKKRMRIKKEKSICKNEIKLLYKIRQLPEELTSYIYSFIKNDVKFNISFYKTLFTKYIHDYINKNRDMSLSVVFKDYSKDCNYCTFNKTALLLKEILGKIPVEKLEKYTFFGTPSKYFNIAFPFEPDIKLYFEFNYENKSDKYEDMLFQKKNYIFEILDLLSYFSTRVIEWHTMDCTFDNKFLTRLKYMNNVYNFEDYVKQTQESFLQNEMIFKKMILSIIKLSNFNNL